MYHDQLNGLLALKVVAEQIAASLDSGLQLRRGHSQFSCPILAPIYGTGNRGRTASYPTAPSQIPACGITAQGSSKLFTCTRYTLSPQIA